MRTLRTWYPIEQKVYQVLGQRAFWVGNSYPAINLFYPLSMMMPEARRFNLCGNTLLRLFQMGVLNVAG
jgi:hypothetical protein